MANPERDFLAAALHAVVTARYLAVQNSGRKIRHVRPWVEDESLTS